jgi:hypothetical protein
MINIIIYDTIFVFGKHNGLGNTFSASSPGAPLYSSYCS